jgi:outer membrane receptor protein involved in Fe transport
MVEANIAGDLAQMKAGPLSYALGTDYRENSYDFFPDNLSVNGNYTDPIAGLFPNAPSDGDFHVSELYGELLIPIVSKGPKGADHFNIELGGRGSDWSIDSVGTLASYKGLIDWGITPRYRFRGGVNRAHRAPNLGELYQTRTQIFGGVSAVYQDPCSKNNQLAPFSANPAAPGGSAAQAAQTEAICRQQMGQTGAASYYSQPTNLQPTGIGFFGGGNGIQNSTGNPELHEEEADTLTLGIVMQLFDSWQLSVDYYNIDISDMIAVQSPDVTHEDCYSLTKNPTGDPLAEACTHIFRNPTNGTPANIDLTYSNLGAAVVSGVDLQVNWNHMFGGGGFNLNSVLNYALEQKTKDTPSAQERDWVGTSGPCALQLQCQAYEWRIFTTANYFHGPWSIQLRHQYWPKTDPGQCATPVAPGTSYAKYDACQAALLIGSGVQSDYQLFALSGSYRFGDKYTLNVGIENLLDEKPPQTGANPFVANDASNYNGTACPITAPTCNLNSLNTLPYALPATYTAGGLGGGAGATYDTLGRRGFISFTMDF